jgi:hypothetical protein
MSIDGSVCFFVMYHYKTNAILVKPIANLDDRSIFESYKELFKTLEAKGYKPRMNVMDNQATKFIKQFLTKKDCNLQVVKPYNHRVNAAECAIQTFQDAFIATLAITDWEFPLKLWDKLAPQVQNTLNLLRASRINPKNSAYEALNGPYNWERYPLAPPGCKAVIYEAPVVRGLWALQGTDAWLLGSLKDHYRCNLYYIPETRAYQVSGSAELFPQHCQVSILSNTAHLKALTKELATSTGEAVKTHKGRALIHQLKSAIKDLLVLPVSCKQRVVTPPIEAPSIPDNTQVPITRILEVPAIMQMQDPMAKQNLIKTKRLHRRLTRNNTPGAVLPIERTTTPTMIPLDEFMLRVTRQSTQVIQTHSSPMMTFTPLPGGV